MNGIGQIVAGSKKQMAAKEQASSRAPWITGQLESYKLKETAGDIYSSLALGGSLASSYMKAMEPLKAMSAGAKAAGVDMPKMGFMDKMGAWLGGGTEDMLKKTYDVEGGESYQHNAGDPLSVKQTHQYSGATLMDIGKRVQSGTLESYLGDDSVGSKFGKDISEQKWWDAKMGQVDAHQPSEFSDSPWSAKDRQLVDSVGMENFMAGQKREASRAAGSSYGAEEPDMVSDHPDLSGTGGSAEYKALHPDDYTFYGNPQNKDKFAPWDAPPPPPQSPQEPIYSNMMEADYGGAPTNIGGAADTSDLTDYASYDTGYRTSNAHASGYANMGVDPNEGGQTSMMGSGGAGDTGYYDDQPTDMSGDTLYGRENKRFTHHEMPGYLGQSLRSGEVGDLENNPLQGYESGYDQSWLRPGRSMYSTVGDSLR